MPNHAKLKSCTVSMEDLFSQKRNENRWTTMEFLHFFIFSQTVYEIDSDIIYL